MSTELMLMRTPGGIIIAADEQSRQVLERWPLGVGIRAVVTRARSLPFHRRFFAMLNLGFDAWEPQLEDGSVKNFEAFREDVTILAGFFQRTVRVRGGIKLKAESISFANMKQDRFDKVYSRVADVILQRILTKYTRDDLDNVVNQMMGFL